MNKHLRFLPLFLIIFAFFFVWFTIVHPAVLYDTDDWSQGSLVRSFLPVWHGWNPIKVLPETLYPLVIQVAGLLIYPFTGNFSLSITLLSALTISLFITIYFIFSFRVVSKIVPSTTTNYLFTFSLFFLLHFVFFITNSTNKSKYFFWSIDLLCYYHYLIPALINCAFISLFLLRDNKTNDLNYSSLGILCASLYLSIFSNVLHSAVLQIYISLAITTEFWIYRKSSKKIIVFFKQKWIFIASLSLWLISLLFESQGGRAVSIGKSFDFFQISKTLAVFLSTVKSTNYCIFFSTCSVILVGFLCVFLKDSYQNYRKVFTNIFLTLLFYFIYLVLVCSKAGSWYIGRTDVTFGLFFLYCMLFSLSLLILMNEIKSLNFFLGPTIVTLVAFSILSKPHFFSSVMDYESEASAIQITNNIVEQIITADALNIDPVYLSVPASARKDNWPFGTYAHRSFSNLLLKQHIIKNSHRVIMKPSEEMSSRHGLVIRKHNK